MEGSLAMLPIAHVRDLLRAIMGWGCGCDDGTLSRPWLAEGDAGVWLSQSAWSLRILSEWANSKGAGGRGPFWIPDFFCNQSLAGLRIAGIRVLFYPISEDLEPDWDKCRAIAEGTPPGFFLLVHFFGRVTNRAAAKEFCAKNSSMLVEDCAHLLLPPMKAGPTADFTLFSPHKQLPLPDGALLVVRATLLERLGIRAEDAEKEMRALVAKYGGGRTGLLRWLVRQVARGYVFRRRPLPSADRAVWSEAAAAPKMSRRAAQSRISRRLLQRYVPRLEAFGWARSENVSAGQLLGKWRSDDRMLVPAIGDSFPFLFGVQRSREDLARDLLARARKWGIPVSTWPDLAPEVVANGSEHDTAIQLRRTAVYFPVHSSGQMVRALRRLGMARQDPFHKARTNRCGVEWGLESPGWREMYSSAPRSNLMQSPAYARAKAESEGMVARYGVVYLAGNPIGTIVGLEKRLLLGGAFRINRGPAWLDPVAATTEVFPAFSRSCVGLMRGLLLFGPNVEISPSSLAEISAQGFRRRLIRPWQSIIVDLRQDEERLRANLRGKWRNQLRAAEKAEVIAELSEDAAAFEWLMGRHSEFMGARGFNGPPPQFLGSLRAACQDLGEHFWVLRAVLSGEPIAGIAVVTHGTTCTYLIGWCSGAGRKANATNLLLWRAFVHTRRSGISWFDLGGVDEWRTPGIAGFKRGTGGAEYRLLGEYWRLL